MHRLMRAAAAAALVAVFSASTVAAAAPARGFMPANAKVFGYSATDLVTAWAEWGFASATDNPNVNPRCEQSSLNPKIWFLPVSFGGTTEVTCNIPSGAFLVMFAGGTECSQAEPEPWHGDDAADLASCVDETLAPLTYAEVTVDGRTSNHLEAYIAASRAYMLPADNLLSPDPTLSMTKGYFLVVHPMSRGTHTLSSYDEFDYGFTGGVNYTITVG